MTPMVWGLLGAAGLCALADWAAVLVHGRSTRWVTKPGVMVLLILAASAAHPAVQAERPWLIAGLVLGLAGDLLLLGESSRAFLAGLVAFLAGHLAFIAGFRTLPFNPGGAAAAGGIAIASAAVLLPIYVRALRSGGRSALVIPVIAYVAAISVMLVSAWGTLVPLAMVGGLLFYASDAELAWDRFVKPIRRGRLVNIVLYQAGQAALAASLVSTTIG